MSVIESPSQTNVQMEVDPTFASARVSLRPHEFKGAGSANIGGHYRTVVTTGATTLIAAGGPLFSIRWANPDRALLINRIRVGSTIGTAFGAAQELAFDLCRVTAMGNPDTGGTAITLAESGRKSRSNMQPTVIADMRVAAAAALGAGVGSIEETPMAMTLMGGLLNAAGSMSMQTLYDIAVGHEGPVVVVRNEGIRIRNRTVMGAAGVVVSTFEIEWSEVPTGLLGA